MFFRARRHGPAAPAAPEAPTTSVGGPQTTAEAAPAIEFLCRPEDRGVIAEPVPAKLVLPEWFRRLPAIDPAVLSATNNGVTIKRCMPFLDAMTLGYILPLAATVRLQLSDEGRKIDTGWEFDRTMVSSHGAWQIAGHPLGPRPPMKFHNYWTIRTPPGWSCLFVPPLNRPAGPFEILAGVVDTDSYTALVNFPFVATGADGVHTLEKGTPLVQVIPFRRDEAALGLRLDHEPGERLAVRVAEENDADARTRERILRNTEASDGWYRKEARARR